MRLLPEERKAIAQHGTGSAEAYQILLMARHYRHFGVISGARVVLRLAKRAVEIDPNYAEAWALIAACQITLHENAGVDETGLTAAERALQIDPRRAAAHAAKGRVLAGLGRHDEALAAHAQSLHLDPESFDAHFFYGHTCTGLGRAPEEPVGLYNLACTFAMLGERDRAIDLLERYAVHMRPQFVAWIKNDSDLDGLRDDPRLPGAWKPDWRKPNGH